jgi:branched-chain amino acid transport system permease protein
VTTRADAPAPLSGRASARRAPASGLWGVSPRQAAALALLLGALLLAPLFVGDFLVSVLVVILMAAYLGQAWNVLMGFAGILSLGHALYYGLGAYAASAMFVHFGLSPWIGALAGAAVASAAGCLIGTLGFRFGVKGVYFALLTISFAEFTRILFDHFEWVGASGGFFLPVEHREGDDLWNLRGSPAMFYYVALALAAGALALCHALLRGRVGHYWQAIREDADAAAALGIDLFRYRIAAIAISSAMTSAGGVVFAFYHNNLYPETTFAMHRSIEMILAPIVGGLGTLFGPILGAFLLHALGETLTHLTEGLGVDGIKQWFYGIALLAIVALRPQGVWPWLRRRLGLEPRP